MIITYTPGARKIMKKILKSCILLLFLLTMNLHPVVAQPPVTTMLNDYDPLVNIVLTFELLKIRSLEKYDNHLLFREYIDRYSYPDFYVKVFVNDIEFRSKVWRNSRYIYDPDWSFTVDVPDDEELVNITIQLWDWEPGIDKLCDISPDTSLFSDSYDVELKYSIRYGCWWGDDHLENNNDPIGSDYSGYGRLNGCDDGSIYQHERDCELWFNIYQNDFDGDGIPYWPEVYDFQTDPTVDDRGRDDDADGVSYEWEYKFGNHVYQHWRSGQVKQYYIYSPFEFDDHLNLDLDNDGLNNVEEYITAEWGSDPFRKDLFVELDEMEDTPEGFSIALPEESKELLRTVYNRRNIVYHLDDGCMGGGEKIPYDELTSYNELIDIYNWYFLENNEDNWRKGIFHYGLVINEAEGGYGFIFLRDAYQISMVGMEKQVRNPIAGTKDVVYASAYMHECGHTLGIFHGNTPGCDDQESKFPWQLNWWIWRPYKSVMNYGYMYQIVDYSDGSRGKNDFDDWNRLDLTFFQS